MIVNVRPAKVTLAVASAMRALSSRPAAVPPPTELGVQGRGTHVQAPRPIPATRMKCLSAAGIPHRIPASLRGEFTCVMCLATRQQFGHKAVCRAPRGYGSASRRGYRIRSSHHLWMLISSDSTALRRSLPTSSISSAMCGQSSSLMSCGASGSPSASRRSSAPWRSDHSTDVGVVEIAHASRPSSISACSGSQCTRARCTGAIGLIAVFAVDLLNLFYISLLASDQSLQRLASPP